MKISYLVFITLAWFCWIGSTFQSPDDNMNSNLMELEQSSQMICSKQNKDCENKKKSSQLRLAIYGFFKNFDNLLLGQCDAKPKVNDLLDIVWRSNPANKAITCIEGEMGGIRDDICSALTQAVDDIAQVEKWRNRNKKQKPIDNFKDLLEVEGIFRTKLSSLAEKIETNAYYENRAVEKVVDSMGKEIKRILQRESEYKCQY